MFLNFFLLFHLCLVLFCSGRRRPPRPPRAMSAVTREETPPTPSTKISRFQRPRRSRRRKSLKSTLPSLTQTNVCYPEIIQLYFNLSQPKQTYLSLTFYYLSSRNHVSYLSSPNHILSCLAKAYCIELCCRFLGTRINTITHSTVKLGYNKPIGNNKIKV